MGCLLAQRLVLATQAALLRKTAPAAVADAFIATRLGEAAWRRVVGALGARRVDTAALLARASRVLRGASVRTMEWGKIRSCRRPPNT